MMPDGPNNRNLNQTETSRTTTIRFLRRSRLFNKILLHYFFMLGKIANYFIVILHNVIVKNSTPLEQIWQFIRLHFDFQSSGAYFLYFNDISLRFLFSQTSTKGHQNHPHTPFTFSIDSFWRHCAQSWNWCYLVRFKRRQQASSFRIFQCKAVKMSAVKHYSPCIV